MAVRFDASGEHYTQSLSLGLQGAFSVSMWARLAVDRNTWGTFLAFQSTNSLLLEVGNDGTSLDVWDDDAGSIVAGPTTLTIGTWYYLAYSAQAGANASFLYVRAADSSVPFTDTWTQGTRTLTTLWLGNNQYGEWINGNLAAVKFWTAGLTQAELELESRQYTPNRVANLQAFYPLVRAQTTDYSGNARTLSGGTGTTTEDGPPIPWRVTSPRLILPASAGGGTTFDLSLASETDSAFTAAASKAATVGLATETDAAFGTTLAKAATLGLATSAESAFEATATKTVTLGLAVETDEAFSLTTSGGVVFTLSLATETDDPFALTASKTSGLALATETDAAQGSVLTKTPALALATEAGTAHEVAWSKAAVLDLAAEVDAALAAILTTGPRRDITLSGELEQVRWHTTVEEGNVTAYTEPDRFSVEVEPE